MTGNQLSVEWLLVGSVIFFFVFLARPLQKHLEAVEPTAAHSTSFPLKHSQTFSQTA